MDELPPKAAALLRAARREHDPNRADSERVRHALAAALAAPALGDAGEQALTLSKAAGRWLSAGWIKGVALVGLVAGATLVATWKTAEKPAPAPVQRARVATAPVANVAAPVAREPEPRASARNAEPVSSQAPVRERVAAHAASTPPARPAPALAPRARSRAPAEPHANEAHGSATTSSVALPAAQPVPEAEQAPSELALMRRALERLNAGDAHGALEQLSLHATRFPNGVMTEERDGLRAVAWCKGGDPARGAAAAHGFLRLYPDSPLVARVRGACKDGAL